jgi:23S rRNA (guanosine2251-2'-O)-methyltransferase
MRQIVVIAHDIRSSHNVGSLLRTCEGLGVTKVYFTGYTPFPRHANDERLPHIAVKVDAQINKTALGAEQYQAWEHRADIGQLLTALKREAYELLALEQAPNSQSLPQFVPADKVALLLGNEVNGVDRALLTRMNHILEIPMYGQKESYNVVEAASMALYHLRFL